VFATDQHLKSSYINDLDDAIWNRIKSLRTHFTINQEEPQSPPLKGGAMCGILFKQTPKGSWQRKYCEIIGTKFRWFKSPEDKAKGNPPIATLFIINLHIILWPVTDRPYCFRVDTPHGKSLFFAADSGPKRMQWVNSLRNPIRSYINELKELQSPSLSLSEAKSPKQATKSPKSEEKRTGKIIRRTTEKLLSKADINFVSPRTSHKDKTSSPMNSQNNFILYKENKKINLLNIESQ